MSAAPCSELASDLFAALPATPFEWAKAPAELLLGPANSSRRPPVCWTGACDASFPAKRSPAKGQSSERWTCMEKALQQLSGTCLRLKDLCFGAISAGYVVLPMAGRRPLLLAW